MRYRFEFRPYQRRFRRPLVTSHGIWDIREGIILCFTDFSGKVGWGEIAPISWFGSETLDQAVLFCRQLPSEITEKTIFSIPDELPACQFGFESALVWGDEKVNSPLSSPSPPITYSALLPAGEAALEQWQKLWEQGYRTFKWKIGVDATSELKIFELLTQSLPQDAKLRLDANGGLSYDDANLWLLTCDNIHLNNQYSVEIEFIEQPLAVDQFPAMLALSNYYKTCIALDESVATLKQLAACYEQGWRDIFVIKPGIIGSPSRLRQFCQNHKIDAVFSSVFETQIGREAALKLAAELSPDMAVGFGVNHFFEPDEDNLQYLWN